MEVIDAIIKRRIGKINYEQRLAFAVSFFCGIICHLFVMVGHYPAYSGLNLFVNDWHVQLMEGRWFGAILMKMDGDVTLPFILGIIMLVAYSLANAVSVDILELHSKTSIFLFSAVFISFPVVASRCCYMYWVDCYSIAICFACIGVWFWKEDKSWWSSIFSVICLTLSIGAYQADLSFALVLFAIVILLELISGKQYKEIFANAFRAIVVVIIALALWYAVFRITLCAFSIVPVKSPNISVVSIMAGIKKAYMAFYWFFCDTFFASILGKCVVWFYIVLVIYYAIKICTKMLKARTKYSAVLIVIIFLILPLISNYTFLVSPNEDYNARLFFADIFLIELPIVFSERVASKNDSYKKIEELREILIGFCTVITVCYFIVVSNTAYMNAYLIYERDYSLAVRIIDRIEMTEGYTPGMDVVVINEWNHYDTEDGMRDHVLKSYVRGMDQNAYSVVPSGFGLQKFMQQFIYSNVNIRDGSVDSSIKDLLEPFPSNKCSIVIDGTMYLYIAWDL